MERSTRVSQLQMLYGLLLEVFCLGKVRDVEL